MEGGDIRLFTLSRVRSQQMVSTPIAELNSKIVQENGWNKPDFIIQVRSSFSQMGKRRLTTQRRMSSDDVIVVKIIHCLKEELLG